MKNFTIITLLTAMMAVFFACSQAPEEKQAREGDPSIELEALMLAKKNALMGYETQNPLYLITAAQLLIDFPSDEVEVKSADEPGVDEIESKAVQEVELNPTILLDDAALYAHGNELTLGMIANLEEQITPVLARGAVGGPYMITRRVNMYSTNTYSVHFRANELAEVAIIGDGDTDLDLFVFDSNDNLIVSDTNYSDRCYVSWTPRWTGEFFIVVKNYGSVYNQFILITN